MTSSHTRVFSRAFTPSDLPSSEEPVELAETPLPSSPLRIAEAGEELRAVTETGFRVPTIFSRSTRSGGASDTASEDLLQSFETELSNFQSQLEEHPEAATASLERLETLAGRIDTLPAGPHSDDFYRAHYAQALQAWNQARSALFQLRDALDRPLETSLNDSQITDRMRDAAESLADNFYGAANAQAVDDLREQLIRGVEDVEFGLPERLDSQALLDFLTSHEMAQALQAGAEAESSAGDAVGLYLAAAQHFTALGLNHRAEAVLEAAWQRANSIESLAAQLQAQMQVAAGYQSAGMIEQASRSFGWIAFAGESSLNPEVQNIAYFAESFRHLNAGEFEAAEHSLARLPESETTRALAAEIREGNRRARVVQNLQIFQNMIFLYSETHPFPEGVNREEVRSEMLAALQSAAQAALSGENPNLYQAFLATGCNWLENFLFDTPHGRALEAISDPTLDNDEFQFRWLRMTDRFMNDNDYAAAGLMAQLMLEVPEMREDGEVYNSRIEYHTSRLEMRRHGANLVGDWISNMGVGILDSGRNFLSFMTIGALGGSLEENIPGTAEFALLIATEGLSLEAEALFTSTRFARGLHPLASRAMGWGVRSGTSALVFSAGGMLIDAAHTRSLERMTVGHFMREFGANMVMFGLLHLSGMASARLPAPLRYAATVSSFVGSDYVNEGLGLRDPLDLPIANRLLNAVTMDAKVRFANWLGNRISGGRFERLRTVIAERHAEHAREHRASRAARSTRERSLGRIVYDANLIMATLLIGGVGGPVGRFGEPLRRPGRFSPAVETPRFRGHFGSEVRLTPEQYEQLISALPSEAAHRNPIDQLHITLIEPAEFSALVQQARTEGGLSRSAAERAVKDRLTALATEVGLGEPTVTGVGSATDGHTVYYATAEWAGARTFRERLGLEPKDFHITLASTSAEGGRLRDVHPREGLEVRKNRADLVEFAETSPIPIVAPVPESIRATIDSVRVESGTGSGEHPVPQTVLDGVFGEGARPFELNMEFRLEAESSDQITELLRSPFPAEATARIREALRAHEISADRPTVFRLTLRHAASTSHILIMANAEFFSSETFLQRLIAGENYEEALLYHQYEELRQDGESQLYITQAYLAENLRGRGLYEALTRDLVRDFTTRYSDYDILALTQSPSFARIFNAHYTETRALPIDVARPGDGSFLVGRIPSATESPRELFDLLSGDPDPRIHPRVAERLRSQTMERLVQQARVNPQAIEMLRALACRNPELATDIEARMNNLIADLTGEIASARLYAMTHGTVETSEGGEPSNVVDLARERSLRPVRDQMRDMVQIMSATGREAPARSIEAARREYELIFSFWGETTPSWEAYLPENNSEFSRPQLEDFHRSLSESVAHTEPPEALLSLIAAAPRSRYALSLLRDIVRRSPQWAPAIDGAFVTLSTNHAAWSAARSIPEALRSARELGISFPRSEPAPYEYHAAEIPYYEMSNAYNFSRHSRTIVRPMGRIRTLAFEGYDPARGLESGYTNEIRTFVENQLILRTVAIRGSDMQSSLRAESSAEIEAYQMLIGEAETSRVNIRTRNRGLVIEIHRAFSEELHRLQNPAEALRWLRSQVQWREVLEFESAPPEGGPGGGDRTGGAPESSASERRGASARPLHVFPEALAAGVVTLLTAAPAHADTGSPVLDGILVTASVVATWSGIIYAGYRLRNGIRAWRAGISVDTLYYRRRSERSRLDIERNNNDSLREQLLEMIRDRRRLSAGTQWQRIAGEFAEVEFELAEALAASSRFEAAQRFYRFAGEDFATAGEAERSAAANVRAENPEGPRDVPPPPAEPETPSPTTIILAPDLSEGAPGGPFRNAPNPLLPASQFEGIIRETFENGRPRRISIATPQTIQGDEYPAGSEIELHPNGSIAEVVLAETDPFRSLGIDGRIIHYWPNGRLQRAVYSRALSGRAFRLARLIGVPKGSEIFWDENGNFTRVRLSRPSEIMAYRCQGDVFFYPDGNVSRFTLSQDLWYNHGRTFREGTTIALDEDGVASEWRSPIQLIVRVR